MANTLEYFQSFAIYLDEIFKYEAKSNILNSDSKLTQMGAKANEIKIPRMNMDGLADYSRSTGYIHGDVSIDFQTVPFNYDRGRKFTIDAMDNEETAGLAFGQLLGEFTRTKVIPEVDAFNFARYAGTEGATKVTARYESATSLIDDLTDAKTELDDNEVPSENRILFIAPSLINSIQKLDTYKSKDVLSDFSSIITVPKSRFYTSIDLLTGTVDDELQGGYKKSEGAGDINFMIIHKSAVMQYTKHLVNKVITPELNQTSDGYLAFFRRYGLTDTYENKVKGIYVNSTDGDD